MSYAGNVVHYSVVVSLLMPQSLMNTWGKILFGQPSTGILEAAQELIDYGADTDLRDNFGHK
jgi:hypothetical protein